MHEPKRTYWREMDHPAFIGPSIDFGLMGFWFHTVRHRQSTRIKLV